MSDCCDDLDDRLKRKEFVKPAFAKESNAVVARIFAHFIRHGFSKHIVLVKIMNGEPGLKVSLSSGKGG